MRRRRDKWPAAVALGLMAGCTVSRDQVVRERMAADYNCHTGMMTVTDLPANGYRVEGCGFTATYSCTGYQSLITCAKEAGSSPVPAVAEDGGTK